MATEAGGTHPTGMHSWIQINFIKMRLKLYCEKYWNSHVGNQEIPFCWIKVITPPSVSGIIFPVADPRFTWGSTNLSLADPRGAPGTRAPPLGVQILSFSCSFRQKCEK